MLGKWAFGRWKFVHELRKRARTVPDIPAGYEISAAIERALMRDERLRQSRQGIMQQRASRQRRERAFQAKEKQRRMRIQRGSDGEVSSDSDSGIAECLSSRSSDSSESDMDWSLGDVDGYSSISRACSSTTSTYKGDYPKSRHTEARRKVKQRRSKRRAHRPKWNSSTQMEMSDLKFDFSSSSSNSDDDEERSRKMSSFDISSAATSAVASYYTSYTQFGRSSGTRRLRLRTKSQQLSHKHGTANNKNGARYSYSKKRRKEHKKRKKDRQNRRVRVEVEELEVPSWRQRRVGDRKRRCFLHCPRATIMTKSRHDSAWNN